MTTETAMALCFALAYLVMLIFAILSIWKDTP